MTKGEIFKRGFGSKLIPKGREGRERGEGGDLNCGRRLSGGERREVVTVAGVLQSYCGQCRDGEQVICVWRGQGGG